MLIWIYVEILKFWYQLGRLCLDTHCIFLYAVCVYDEQKILMKFQYQWTLFQIKTIDEFNN